MTCLVRPFLVLFFVMSVGVLRGLQIEVDLPYPSITDGIIGDLDALRETIVGKPDLPTTVVTIPVYGKDIRVVDVSVAVLEQTEITIPFVVSTVQMPYSSIPHEDVLPDYDFDTYYPVNVLRDYGITEQDGIKEVAVFLSGTLYCRNQNKLRIFRRVMIEVETEKIPLLAKTIQTKEVASAEYVIISNQDMFDSSEDYNIQKLLSHRKKQGFSVMGITVEEIGGNYEGRDLQEKIRAFCRYAYENHKTRFLLIAGGRSVVPVRYFESQNAPSDYVYYGCLDGSMDANTNNLFGEVKDGETGKKIDSTAEIIVGRLPVANHIELREAVRKTIEADSQRPSLDVGVIAEFMGDGWYSSSYMEHNLRPLIESRNISETGLFYDCIYDVPDAGLKKEVIYEFMQRPQDLLLHFGHGASTWCFKTTINEELLSSLKGHKPVIYSVSCSPGNLDFARRCAAERIIIHSNFTHAVCMNTRYGWYHPSTQKVFSQQQLYVFAEQMTGDALYLGEAFDASQKCMIPGMNQTSWVLGTHDKCFYSVMLFGCPASPVFPVSRDIPISIENIETQDYPFHVNVRCRIHPSGFFNYDKVYLTAMDNRLLMKDADGYYSGDIDKDFLTRTNTITVTAENWMGTEFSQQVSVDPEFYAKARFENIPRDEWFLFRTFRVHNDGQKNMTVRIEGDDAYVFFVPINSDVIIPPKTDKRFLFLFLNFLGATKDYPFHIVTDDYQQASRTFIRKKESDLTR